jgi:hypothetical protein
VSTPPWWSEPAERLLERLHGRTEGLASEDAAARLRTRSPNALRPQARLAGLRLLLRQFQSPLVAILAFAALIAALVGDWTDATMVLVILTGSALLGFVQEYRASALMERLRACARDGAARRPAGLRAARADRARRRGAARRRQPDPGGRRRASAACACGRTRPGRSGPPRAAPRRPARGAGRP